jgi:hypothetical protein
MTLVYMPTVAVNIETPSLAGSGGGYLVFGDATYGLFDTGTFAGPLGHLVNYKTDTQAVTTKRGSTDQNDVLFKAQTGTATVQLDNRARVFDPIADTDIRPRRAIEITATWDAITYKLFTGVVEDWGLTYPAFARNAVTTLSAADATVLLVDAEVTDPLAKQLTGARVGELLDLSGWPYTLRNLAAGRTTMPRSLETVSAWAAIGEAVDSELGELYVDVDGTVVFRDRNGPVTDSRSVTSQATFGDGGGSELKYHDVGLSYDTARIRNDIAVVYNENNDTARAADATSISKYGRKTFTLQASIADGTTAQNLANYLLGLYRDPQVRVDQLILKPAADPADLWPHALGRKFGDKITVKLTPPGGGSRITRTGWIRGISHQATPHGEWTTTFNLQDTTAYATYITFDTSTFDGSHQFWF